VKSLNNKQAWEEQKKKEVISMLESVLDKIKKEELKPVTSGWWHADGHSIFRVDVVDNVDNEKIKSYRQK